MEEVGLGSLQPWQVEKIRFCIKLTKILISDESSFLQLFTAMFVGFWATSAYFDHFLLTGVFCIAYGVVAEVLFLSKCSNMSGKHFSDYEQTLVRRRRGDPHL